MKTMFIYGLQLFFLISALAQFCAADSQAPAALRDVGFDQRLNESIPLELEFTNETGAAVKLADYFGNRPVILVLAYYRCPMLCTLVLNGVVQAMHGMSLVPGKDYNVVTVSFDPRETPALAAAKKKTYVANYGRVGADEGWHFLTGKQEAIEKLTRAVGFRYVYDAKQDQYIHTSGIIVLTPQGRISRYFYGIQFPARDLRLGLVEASANRIGSPTDEVLLYCFHYDPATGKYTASVLNFVRAGGVLTILALAGMVWHLMRHESQKACQRPIDVGVDLTTLVHLPENAHGEGA
jgi:protein SCO1/2